MSLATELKETPGKTEEKVDLRREYEESGVSEILDQLDRELIGEARKDPIREIAALLLVERAKERLGLAHDTPTLHMSLPAIPAPARRRSR